jgi:methionyl-tRNA formyltransferase
MPDRLVLAGNNTAAVYVLDLLLEWLEPEAILVFAPPEESIPSWQRSLAGHARNRGVESMQPANVNDSNTLARITEHRSSLLLSIYYTQLFSNELLEIVNGPSLNFHPSLLPRHRGVAPLIWAIAEGDKETGVSVHLIDEGIDTGDLVLQHSLPIHPDDTGFSLHQKAARLVRGAAAELIRRLAAGGGLPSATPQSGAASSHSYRDPRLNRIDWSSPRERVRNVIRALAPPLPGAYAVIGGEQLVLCHVEPLASPATRSRPPGTLERGEGGQWAQVWCADGPMAIAEAQFSGRRLSGAEVIEALDLGTSRILE